MVGVPSSGKIPLKIGCGLAAKHRLEGSSFRREDRTSLKCSHFGGSRHNKEGSFKLIRCPEWWDDLQRKKVATKAPVNRAGDKALFTHADDTDGERTDLGTTKMVKEDEGDDGMVVTKTKGEGERNTKIEENTPARREKMG